MYFCRKQWMEFWKLINGLRFIQGKRKEQKLLPNHMSVFSSKVPNSTNQTIGNQMNTELGRALVNMNYFFSSGAWKRKLEGELQLS